MKRQLKINEGLIVKTRVGRTDVTQCGTVVHQIKSNRKKETQSFDCEYRGELQVRHTCGFNLALKKFDRTHWIVDEGFLRFPFSKVVAFSLAHLLMELENLYNSQFTRLQYLMMATPQAKLRLG